MDLCPGPNLNAWIHHIHADTDGNTEFVLDEMMNFALACSLLSRSMSEWGLVF